MSYVYPPAGSIGARVLLCLLVVIGQSLSLFPLWLIWYIVFMTTAYVAGSAASLVVTVFMLLLLVAITYPIAMVATFIAERLARSPTSFSPSFVARRTTMGLFVGFCIAGVLLLALTALPRGFIPPETTPAGYLISNVVVALSFVVIIVPSVASTWIASKRHADSL